MRRKIIIPIDAVMAILKDYTKGTGDVPQDAVPLSLMVNTAERGMFGIMAESAEWKDDTPVRVVFDIKRVYGVV
jgi:hypothetical protein